MAKKRNSLTLTVALLTMVATVNSLAEKLTPAEAKDDWKDELVKSPFKGCEEVNLVPPDAYKKNENEWNQRCSEKPNQFQILPNTGMTVDNVQDAAESFAFLQDVGQRSVKVMSDNIAAMEEIQKCFESDSDKCKGVREKEIAKAYDTLPGVRMELALAEGKAVHSMNGAAYSFSPKMIDTSLEHTMLGLKGVYRADDHYPLEAAQVTAAQEQMKKEVDQKLFPQINSGKMPSKEREVAFKKGFEVIQAEHKAAYFSMIQKSPVLLKIGKLPERSEKNDKAIREQFVKAYNELASDAKKELAHQKEMLKKGEANLGKNTACSSEAIRAGNGKDCDKQEGTKDLLGFLSMGTSGQIIEQVLQEQGKKSPKLCAIATGLFLQKQSNESLKMAGIIGGIGIGASVLGGAAGRALMKFLPLMGAAEATATAAGATAMAFGPPLGGYFTYEGQRDFTRARGAVAGGTGTMEALNEAELNKDLNYYSMPLDWLGTGVGTMAGGAIFKQYSKNQLKKLGLEPAKMKQLFGLAKSKDKVIAQKAKQEINEAVKKSLDKSIGRKPNEKELATLDEMAQNGYLPTLLDKIDGLAEEERVSIADKTIKIYQEVKKKKFESPAQQEAAREFLIGAARFRGERKPEKFAKILDTWMAGDEKGIKGASNFFEEYENTVKANPGKYENKALSENKTFKGTDTTVGEEAAMTATFERLGIKEKDKQDEMWMCIKNP